MPAHGPAKETYLKTSKTSPVPTVLKPRERDEAAARPDQIWKPYPCLLTRRELQDVIADQLG
jgi:hypothetical protein